MVLAGRSRFTARRRDPRRRARATCCSSRPTSRTGSTTSPRSCSSWSCSGRRRARGPAEAAARDGAGPSAAGADPLDARGEALRRGARSRRPRRGGTGRTRPARRRGTAPAAPPTRPAPPRRRSSAGAGGTGTGRCGGCRAGRPASSVSVVHRTAPAARSAANVSSTCHGRVLRLEHERDRRRPRAEQAAPGARRRARDLASTRNRTAPSRSPNPGRASVSHGMDSVGVAVQRADARPALRLDDEPEPGRARPRTRPRSSAAVGPRVERVVELDRGQARGVVGEERVATAAPAGRSAGAQPG